MKSYILRCFLNIQFAFMHVFMGQQKQNDASMLSASKAFTLFAQLILPISLNKNAFLYQFTNNTSKRRTSNA